MKKKKNYIVVKGVPLARFSSARQKEMMLHDFTTFEASFGCRAFLYIAQV